MSRVVIFEAGEMFDGEIAMFKWLSRQMIG